MNIYETTINLDIIQGNNINLGVKVIGIKKYDSLFYNGELILKGDSRLTFANKYLLDAKSKILYGRELCALNRKTFLEEVCYGFSDIFDFFKKELFQLNENFMFPDSILERMCLIKSYATNKDQLYNKIRIKITKSREMISTIERELV